MKKLLLFSLSFVPAMYGAWMWNVDLENRAKGIKLHYEDYVIKPGIGGFEEHLVRRGSFLTKKNLWGYNQADAIGRKIVVQGQAGLSASAANQTNKVIIAVPHHISDEDRKASFVLPMTPSGNYDFIWDRSKPGELRATQSHEINPALKEVYGGRIAPSA